MYFPKTYRSHKAALIMMAVELPFTIVVLILTGIAAHNTYRTKLWQDGADNGFNSAPDESLYAAANYRPYKTPMVWSAYVTNYNLVLGVLSTFFLLTKAPIQVLKVFYPPVSVVVHMGLIVLWAVSASYQAGSDTSDPQHPQPGPPWYITKSCSVAAHKSNVHYCEQAKALFAITIMIIVIYFCEFLLALISCFSSKAEREEYRERREEKRALKEYEDSIINSPPSGMYPLTPAPMTGGLPTATPRTLAFNRLGGPNDLPLRTHFSTPHPRSSMQQDVPMMEQFGLTQYQNEQQMFFPPPPKKAARFG